MCLALLRAAHTPSVQPLWCLQRHFSGFIAEAAGWLWQEFAVGVVAKNGEYKLIDSGALPEAVAASAAIPFVFEPVAVPGEPACLLTCPRHGQVHSAGWKAAHAMLSVMC